MKIFLTLLITMVTIASSLEAQTKISPEEAGKFIGDKVTVSGKVTGVVYKTSTKQTLLTLAGSNSNEICTILINASDKKNFSYNPDTYLVNKSVSLTGKLIDVYGNPGMVATKPEDIKFEAEEGDDIEVRSLSFDFFSKFFDED
jgi:hypothetical protein